MEQRKFLLIIIYEIINLSYVIFWSHKAYYSLHVQDSEDFFWVHKIEKFCFSQNNFWNQPEWQQIQNVPKMLSNLC